MSQATAAAEYAATPEADRNRAKVFFDRGTTVAASGQFDYSIEMYLSGLALDPEAVEAHKQLRDIALRRLASGGKGLGMFEKMKLRPGREAKPNLLNAVKLLSFEPGSSDHMLAVMDAGVDGGYFDTALWAGGILMQALRDAPKPDLARLLKLRDNYARLGRFKEAVQAASRALELKPGDMDLQNALRNLSAQETMQKGNYSGGGNFRDSVRDMDKQRQLIESEKDVGNVDYLQLAVKQAEAELAADPNTPGKVGKLAEALLKTGRPEDEEKALKVYFDAFDRTRQYRFKLAASNIRLKQLVKEERALRAELAADKDNPERVEAYKLFGKQRAREELELYREASENYPTESRYKFETAGRLFELGEHGEAIPLYQQTASDPKLRVDSTLRLGQSFLLAEFPDEAVETLRGLVDSYEAQDEKAKDIHYWFARALESANDVPAALKSYSQVARWDFNFRDVQARIKKLRAATAAA